MLLSKHKVIKRLCPVRRGSLHTLLTAVVLVASVVYLVSSVVPMGLKGYFGAHWSRGHQHRRVSRFGTPEEKLQDDQDRMQYLLLLDDTAPSIVVNSEMEENPNQLSSPEDNLSSNITAQAMTKEHRKKANDNLLLEGIIEEQLRDVNERVADNEQSDKEKGEDWWENKLKNHDYDFLTDEKKTKIPGIDITKAKKTKEDQQQMKLMQQMLDDKNAQEDSARPSNERALSAGETGEAKAREGALDITAEKDVSDTFRKSPPNKDTVQRDLTSSRPNLALDTELKENEPNFQDHKQADFLIHQNVDHKTRESNGVDDKQKPKQERNWKRNVTKQSIKNESRAPESSNGVRKVEDNINKQPAKVICSLENEVKLNPSQWVLKSHRLGVNFLINNKHICQGREVSVVFLVMTALWDTERRWLIRNTTRVGDNKGVVTMFLLGTSANQVDTKLIWAENSRNGDIIQGDFLDTYRNLTVKVLMGFQWVLQYCPQAETVYKFDDDNIINTEALSRAMKIRGPLKNDEILCGSVHSLKLMPVRRKPHRWFVDYQEYPHNCYPQYCNGFGGYGLSMNLTRSIWQFANKARIIHLEDLYITGIIPNLLNLRVQFTQVTAILSQLPKRE